MRLALLDFRSQVYRALYTPGQPLTSPSGEPTRGTYYFTRILLNMVRDIRPTHMLVAEDSRTSWRTDLYPDYKKGRHEGRDPDELATLITTVKRCRQVVDLLGIRFLTVKGFEADDIIASAIDHLAAEWEVGDGHDVVIVSRDKDLHQCVGDIVSCYDPQSKEWMHANDVSERWGVAPCQVLEVQTLAGDATDNVPGVRGVGVKTAAKWIASYGSVKGVLRNLEDLPDRFQTAIMETDLEMTRRMVKLRTDVPIKLTLEDVRFRGPDMRAAAPLFRDLGFRSLAG